MGNIYFLQVGTDGPIKIGYVGTDTKRRLRILTGISPHALRWIGVFEGTKFDEKRAHISLRESWIRGEWFDPSAEVLAFIAEKSPDFEPLTFERRPPVAWDKLDRESPKPVTKLKDWLIQEGLTVTEFARRMGRPQPTVARYASGDRIPEKEAMQQIMELTKDKVTANDFYRVTP